MWVIECLLLWLFFSFSSQMEISSHTLSLICCCCLSVFCLILFHRKMWKRIEKIINMHNYGKCDVSYNVLIPESVSKHFEDTGTCYVVVIYHWKKITIETGQWVVSKPYNAWSHNLFVQVCISCYMFSTSNQKNDVNCLVFSWWLKTKSKDKLMNIFSVSLCVYLLCLSVKFVCLLLLLFCCCCRF